MRSSVCPRWLDRYARAESCIDVEDLKGLWFLESCELQLGEIVSVVRTVLYMHAASQLHG
jgi:hypothetical protein